MSWKIPLANIHLEEEDFQAVTDVLCSNWLSMGPVTATFEQAFAEYLGVRHAIAVSNGTAALHIAHRALGIGEGDEVITPSLTFVATANSILYCGAKPIFADITGHHDFNISPEQICEKISPKTRAITVVHYGGYPCAMKDILDIACDHHLAVIEDAAHATGAMYRDRKCGTIGDVGCFSFFANKNLATGEGGMVVTNDDALADRIRLLRSHGMTTLTWDRHQGHAFGYDVVDMGFNYRINEVAAALGITQLGKLDEYNAKRREIVGLYRRYMNRLKGFSSPFNTGTHDSSCHIFPLLLPAHCPREYLMRGLKQQGIQTSIHYPPIHQFTYYQKMFGYNTALLPNTEYIGAHEMTLPLYPALSENDIRTILEAVEELYEHVK